MKRVKYYQLKNTSRGCPRRTLFYLEGLEGRPQYYAALKRRTKQRILDYLKGRFPNSELFGDGDIYDPDNEFEERLRESGSEEVAALAEIVGKRSIELTRIRETFDYPLEVAGEEVLVEMRADAIGTLDGEPALMKIATSSRYSEYALELACIEALLEEDHYEIFVLRLPRRECRKIRQRGDRTKSGRLSKRGLAPWPDLVEQAEGMMREAVELREAMRSEPEAHDRPEFGPCSTCPFHNYTVVFRGREVNCAGG
jgi:hypothetical protein